MPKIRLRRLRSRLHQAHPVRLLLLGYGLYILTAWLLLCLPISWQDGTVSALDNLFIATSAFSTTGLVTVNTPGLVTVNTPDAYSFLGELVVLLGFQVGGLGYMTLGSFVLIASKQFLSTVRRRVGTTVFSLPEGFSLKTFIQHTVVFTLISEFLGGIFLSIYPVPKIWCGSTAMVRYFPLSFRFLHGWI